MAKLIYIDLSVASLKSEGNFISQYSSAASTNSRYYSLVFTNDGHLVTHGIDFSIAPSTSVLGGSVGSILYQSATDTTTFLAAPASSAGNATNGNYILSYSGSAPVWKKIVNYKLTLNNSTLGDSNGTSLGSFYAPTTAGSSDLILVSAGSGAPTWKASILTKTGETTGTTNGYLIPTYLKVQELIGTSVTSLFSWQGNATVTSGTLTIPSNPKVGYAYRIPAATTLPQANSSKGEAETLEAGDIIICTDTTGPKFTTVQTNWATLAGTSALSWNTEVTLGTVGGLAIKAKLPVDPVTRIAYTTSVASDAAGVYTLGTLDKDSNASATIYGIDTQYSFFVGATGATAYAKNQSNPFVTVKANTANAATDILQLVGSTGIEIKTDSTTNGKINIKNTGVTAVTRTVQSSADGAYEIATFTVNGSSYSIYGHDIDTNTWRDVKVYKMDDSNVWGSNSIGTSALKFSNTFSVNSNDEIDLVWDEIDSSGNTHTYHV